MLPFFHMKEASAAKNTEFPGDFFFLSSCWVAFGRPFYLWTVLPDVPRHWRVPPASGGHPPRLIPPSGVGLIAWRLRPSPQAFTPFGLCLLTGA